MGVAGSPDIFQAKMSELMSNLEFVRTYLDNLLIITKVNLSDHWDKLKGNHKVARSRLKVNPTNQSSVPMKWVISNIS
jgi:hypothetical protein